MKAGTLLKLIHATFGVIVEELVDASDEVKKPSIPELFTIAAKVYALFA
jgi:hypothetical protein